MDDEAKRAAHREAVRRFRERLKQDPVRFATAVARSRERQRVAYRTNHERLLQRQRAYTERNRQVIYARNREYAARNREKIRTRQHEAYVRDVEANRERDRERKRKSYAANPGAHLDYMKRWRAANSERARAYVRLSGHRRRAASGGEYIRVEDWLALLMKYEGRCAYGPDHGGPIEADHRVPLSRGGLNTIENILPACQSCNRRKHTRTEKEFRALLAARFTESAMEKPRDSGKPDGLAEATGPYRITPSKALGTRTARYRSRCPSPGRQGDRSRARDRQRC